MVHKLYVNTVIILKNKQKQVASPQTTVCQPLNEFNSSSLQLSKPRT